MLSCVIPRFRGNAFTFMGKAARSASFLRTFAASNKGSLSCLKALDAIDITWSALNPRIGHKL